MEQLLSQEEIEALLAGVSGGDETADESVDQAAKAPESATPAILKPLESRVFDFARATKGRKERFPALDFVADRFSKSLVSALTLFLEREVEISLTPMQYVEYGEFIKTLPLPTNMNIVTTESLRGFFMVIFDARLIFCVLETLFGSSTISPPKVDGREFTRIEFGIIRKLIDVVAVEMEKAWEPVYEMRCKYSRSEINPSYITMISHDETVVILECSVEIAGITGWMKICVPYGILETIKGYLVSTPSREDMEMRSKWLKALERSVEQVPLELRAVLGRKKLSVQEFLNIKEGSVILTDTVPHEPIDVTIMNRKKIRGRMGAFKGNKAISVEEILE
jgi:flagellar motor switch protein FliM